MSRIDELVPEYEHSIELIDELILKLREEYINGNTNGASIKSDNFFVNLFNKFKYVFIAAVNNRIIPLPSAINKTDVVSEAESITSEKCLLYVAMTRAQKGVYITSYGRPSEFLG